MGSSGSWGGNRMGLLDDLSRREAKAEPKQEPPAVGHYAVKLDLKEEKVSLTAGQTKEYPVIVTNTRWPTRFTRGPRRKTSVCSRSSCRRTSVDTCTSRA